MKRPGPAGGPGPAETLPPKAAARIPPVFGQSEPQVLDRHPSIGWIALLSLLAIALAVGIGYGNYTMGQEPHRLAKILVGLLVVGVFLMRPAWALVLLPFVFPFITWLPKSSIPLLNATNLLLISMFMGWIGRTVQQRQRFFDSSPWNLPLAIFVFWALFSWLHATLMRGGFGYAMASFQGFWSGISGVLMFFVVFNTIRTRAQVRTMALLFCVGGALGLFGLLRESHGLGGGRRVSGGLGQENEAGAFFATAALFTLGLLAAGYRGWLRRGLLLCSLAASAAATILPASRGAMLGFLAGALPQAVRGGVVWILVLVLLVGGFLVWAPDYVKERVQRTELAATQDGGSRYEALNETGGGRLDFWQAALKVIAHSPVIGVGWGRMIPAMEPYLGKSRPPHNLYLETAGEMGIPGLALLLWLFWVPLRTARSMARERGFPRGLAFGVSSALIGFLVANVFGGRFFSFSAAGSISLLAALLFRTRLLPDEEADDLMAEPPPGQTTQETVPQS
jgi:O-antigen ligase